MDQKTEELLDRTFNFGVNCLLFLETLPKSKTFSIIIFQLGKASTSIGANYEEAQSAESSKDFIHKIGVVSKETRESNYWLRVLNAILIESKKTKEFKNFFNESLELKKIFTSIKLTVNRIRQKKNLNPKENKMSKLIKKHQPSNIKHFPFSIFHFPLIFVLVITLLTGCGNDNGNDMTKKEQTYYCPMHPQVQSDKPGVCPICHMDLVLKGSDETMEEDLDGVVSLSDNKLILANVSTVKVVKEKLNNVITSYSYLDFAEQNRKLVTTRFNGRIEKIFVDKTGDYVRQGEPLFEIYSPDLVQAQNDFLIAIENRENIKLISDSENKYDNPLVKSARKKLQLFGITDSQINELEKTGEVKLTITYYSPMNGTVIEKKIQEGMYVNEGTIVYDIADLSTLWNISEVFENDLGQIKEGNKVQLTFQSYPGEIFEGKVALIYPVVDQQSRTVKVRSVVQNKGNKLKPNMYGETIFENKLGESLVIPEDAVLFTGERKLVYVKVDEGKFEQREVKLGYKINNKYQVLSGLTEGEEIAATGAYLIDSESQLKSGKSSSHQHGDVDTKEKEEDHSKHTLEQMKEKEIGNNIIHKRDVKVSTLDKNKDGFVYQCPMDWEVISDVPGSCPICKMDLEKFSVDEAQKNLIEYP